MKRFLPLCPDLVALVELACAVCLIAAMFVMSQSALRGTVDATKTWVSSAFRINHSDHIANLFDSAVHHGFIYYDSVRDEVILKSSREIDAELHRPTPRPR